MRTKKGGAETSARSAEYDTGAHGEDGLLERVDMKSSTLAMSHVKATSVATARYHKRVAMADAFLTARQEIMDNMVLARTSFSRPGMMAELLASGGGANEVANFERGGKVLTVLHTQLGQLEGDFIARLDDSLKAKSIKQQLSTDEFPKFTNELLDGEPLQILKHVLRQLKRKLSSMFMPYILVLYMVESYSGEMNMCLPPPVSKGTSQPYSPLKRLMAETLDQQNITMWDDLENAMQDLPTLRNQSKQVVRFGAPWACATVPRHAALASKTKGAA
jgi:hypothetical protein